MLVREDQLTELLNLPHAEARQAWALETMTPETAEALWEHVRMLAQKDLQQALAAGLALMEALLPCRPGLCAFGIWAYGVALRAASRFDEAVAHFRQAGASFRADGLDVYAARTVIGEIAALGYLGRYDDAHNRAAEARKILVAHGAYTNAAQLDFNLAGVWMRQDKPRRALEAYIRAAEIIKPEDEPMLAGQIVGNLACAYLALDEFRTAQAHFEHARATFVELGLTRRVAHMDVSLGHIQLWQGHYQEADAIFERVRPILLEQGLIREAAIVDSYQSNGRLALNLLDEALTLAERAADVFRKMELSQELGPALVNVALALGRLGRHTQAQEALTEACVVLESGEHTLLRAMAESYAADLALAQGHAEEALANADSAIETFQGRRLPLRAGQATILLGEALAQMGRDEAAETAFEGALKTLESVGLPWIRYRAKLGLGRLRAARGDFVGAKATLQAAVDDVEAVHANLGLEEFKVGYFGDKLAVYEALVGLCLGVPEAALTPAQVTQALSYVERAKGRALIETLVAPEGRADEANQLPWLAPDTSGGLAYHANGNGTGNGTENGAFHKKGNGNGAGPRRSGGADDPTTLARIAELRTELNWFYNRLNASEVEGGERLMAVSESLHGTLLAREQELKQLTRRRSLTRQGGLWQGGEGQRPYLSPTALQAMLQPGTLLIEYYCLQGELIAFSLDRDSMRVHRGMASLESIQGALQRLHFQWNKFRLGPHYTSRHTALLLHTTEVILTELYEHLLAPLQPHLDAATRLIVVPHGPLHLLPFHILWHEGKPLLEQYEVSYAPSASVLSHCLAQRPQPGKRALVMGVADDHIPRVRDEVAAVATHLPGAQVYLDEEATIQRLWTEAGEASVLHLATHGLFRTDNPLFSALKLADGWLSLADIANLKLPTVELVTLSACETGMTHVTAGDELIGLSRAFFATGTPSLVVSLWTVDDQAAATLMARFYAALADGLTKTAALRRAQLETRADHPHPYFWAPFVLLGQPR